MNRLYYYFFIMFIVTYLIRVTPLIFMKGKNINSKFIRSFLGYVPYAVLGSMSFPAIFFSTGNLKTGVIGSIVIIFLSYNRQSLTKVALAGVITVYISSLILK